jgi:hypothetical protein
VHKISNFLVNFASEYSKTFWELFNEKNQRLKVSCLGPFHGLMMMHSPIIYVLWGHFKTSNTIIAEFCHYNLRDVTKVKFLQNNLQMLQIIFGIIVP